MKSVANINKNLSITDLRNFYKFIDELQLPKYTFKAVNPST